MGEALPEMESMVGTIATAETPEKWYAAYTMPRHEKLVANQLTLRAVETYLPLYRAIHNWNGRKAEVDLPLFPGYVFCQFDATSAFRF